LVGQVNYRVDVASTAVVLTVDGVFKLPEGSTVTPHLDAERLPPNSRLVIGVARQSRGTSQQVSGRFEVWHFRYLDGTGGYKGVIALDPEFSDAVAVGDVLTIRVAEPSGVSPNQTT
jgi:hypothetical protein